MTIPDPRTLWCPACHALAGQPCTVASERGRRPVTWHHTARTDNAAHHDPVAPTPLILHMEPVEEEDNPFPDAPERPAVDDAHEKLMRTLRSLGYDLDPVAERIMYDALMEASKPF